jgi:hypothetical protein
MTKAIITAQNGYRCAPCGAVVVRFDCGDMVDGSVAEWAVSDGAAQYLTETKPAQALETKPAIIKRSKK